MSSRERKERVLISISMVFQCNCCAINESDVKIVFAALAYYFLFATHTCIELISLTGISIKTMRDARKISRRNNFDYKLVNDWVAVFARTFVPFQVDC